MVTAKEALEAFKAEERVEGFYEGLTEEEKIDRNILYTQLKINVDIEADKVQAWNDAWSAKELELRQAFDVEIQAHHQAKSDSEATLTVPK